MFKVFYVSDLQTGAITTGQSDLKIVEGFYTKVNDQLIAKAYVFLDTEKNRQLITAYREEYKVWKSMEPNMYAMLNAMNKE